MTHRPPPDDDAAGHARHDHDLAGQAPFGQLDERVESWSRVTSSDSMRRSAGKSGRASRLEGALESVGVVDERADTRRAR